MLILHFNFTPQNFGAPPTFLGGLELYHERQQSLPLLPKVNISQTPLNILIDVISIYE
jgi:hypothetical protein